MRCKSPFRFVQVAVECRQFFQGVILRTKVPAKGLFRIAIIRGRSQIRDVMTSNATRKLLKNIPSLHSLAPPLYIRFLFSFRSFLLCCCCLFYFVNEQKVRLQNTTCALLRSLYCNRTNFDFKVSKALRPRLTTGLPTIQLIPLWFFPKRIFILCSLKIKQSSPNSR